MWYEGFPMIIVEAMMHGRPVIASNLGGIPEIVEDGVTGLLFEAGNADDLAQKIQYLWDHPDLCRQMGEAGRTKARKEYSPDAYYQRLMEVYRIAKTICKS
jgi:glycosyltransferase involved in cell wall biosynthesis